MKHLLKNWKTVRKELRGKKLFIFTDFDGTIAPLARKPGEAGLPEKTRRVLRELCGAPGIRCAVVSGRRLKDLEKQVGLPGVIYSGNHGLEISGPRLSFKGFVDRKTLRALRRIRDELARRTAPFPGAFIEDKSITITLHYRLAGPAAVPRLKRLFAETVRPAVKRKLVRVRPGKKVLEVRPPTTWNKGHAVQWILKQLSPRKDHYPMYLGDDVADEAAFRALRNRGLTVFVGKPRPSRARYYLKDPRDVYLFLQKLNKLVRSVSLCTAPARPASGSGRRARRCRARALPSPAAGRRGPRLPAARAPYRARTGQRHTGACRPRDRARRTRTFRRC